MFSHVKNIISHGLQKFEEPLGLKSKIKWRTTLLIIFFHTFGFYWCCLHAFPVKWQTFVFAYLTTYANGLGLTAGVHRLWTHKCYKATLPLRIFLMFAFCGNGQNSIYDWVRDHRVHHKYSDTEADPHNIGRGFTFAHIGWLMLQKNKQVLEKGRQVDMRDIVQDPVAMFEKKYSSVLRFLTCYFIPTTIGILVLKEKWQCAVAWHCFIRVAFLLHAEMSVNSFAHMMGGKPYNTHIKPAQNRYVSTFALGEGWHNYHHMFPNDYKASEIFDVVDGATFFIRTWAKMGLAWDLKEPTPELIQAVIKENKEKYETEDFPGGENEDKIKLPSDDLGLHSRASAALG